MTMLSFRSVSDPDTILHFNLDRVEMIVVKTKNRTLDGDERDVQVMFGDSALQIAPQDTSAFLAELDKLLGRDRP